MTRGPRAPRGRLADPTAVTEVEIAVHGVGGASPASMLGAVEADLVQVRGDGRAGFYMVRAQAQESPARVREVYSWGRLTSGVREQALWIAFLPFALANVAGWMHVGTRTHDGELVEQSLRDPASAFEDAGVRVHDRARDRSRPTPRQAAAGADEPDRRPPRPRDPPLPGPLTESQRARRWLSTSPSPSRSRQRGLGHPPGTSLSRRSCGRRAPSSSPGCPGRQHGGRGSSRSQCS